MARMEEALVDRIYRVIESTTQGCPISPCPAGTGAVWPDSHPIAFETQKMPINNVTEYLVNGQDPGRVALLFLREEVTYGQLQRRVEQVAALVSGIGRTEGRSGRSH